ncbi:hypothetical protein [Microbacterium sp. PM5]|uniref:hypothetical protein n=1 Tax=Microbacterium sp. PM5 TaxID=2014534 RepID=UPI0013AF21B1|nr:hypothetical protein [Microbacterium sp. PM5]
MLVLTAIGVVVAGAAAVFAWVQAHAALESLKDAREARDDAAISARESARLAGEANAAFIRQAEAQEEANRIKREEMTPPDWSTSSAGSNRTRVVNSSGVTLEALSFDASPDKAADLVRVETSHEDGVYEYGDSFQVLILGLNGRGVEKVTVKYRRQDDPKDSYRTFHLGL